MPSAGGASVMPAASRRVATLLAARLRPAAGEGLPAAALLGHAVLSAFLCGLVHDRLSPFPYALFALSLSAALLALPFLGELGLLVRRDDAREWVESLPVHPRELRWARLLHLLVLLWALALAALVPAAALAPGGPAWGACLVLLGLGSASAVAALLLFVQAALAERAEGLLVVFQSGVVVLVVVGLVLGVSRAPELAQLLPPPPFGEGSPWLWLLPPAWFALPFGANAPGAAAGLAAAVALAAMAGLAALPPAAGTRRRGRSWLELLLTPLRRAAERMWVRRDERAGFQLVADALPREREVVLRAVPMLAIPLAFLGVASASGAAEGGRADLLALLVFTPALYLPVLLAHVSVSATPEAAWLLATGPTSAGATAAGACKALAVRFLAPLYLLLGLLALLLEGPATLPRLVLPGFFGSLLALLWLYPACVPAPPLSLRPERAVLLSETTGLLLGLALALTLAALAASRLASPVGGVAAALLLAAAIPLVERRLRRLDESG